MGLGNILTRPYRGICLESRLEYWIRLFFQEIVNLLKNHWKITDDWCKLNSDVQFCYQMYSKFIIWAMVGFTNVAGPGKTYPPSFLLLDGPAVMMMNLSHFSRGKKICCQTYFLSPSLSPGKLSSLLTGMRSCWWTCCMFLGESRSTMTSTVENRTPSGHMSVSSSWRWDSRWNRWSTSRPLGSVAQQESGKHTLELKALTSVSMPFW